MPTAYDLGDKVRLAVDFKVGATLTDPTTVTFKHRPPAGSTTTLVFGTDAEVVQDATGQYHVDLVLNVGGGIWEYRWEASGSLVSAEQSQLFVRLAVPA